MLTKKNELLLSFVQIFVTADCVLFLSHGIFEKFIFNYRYYYFLLLVKVGTKACSHSFAQDKDRGRHGLSKNIYLIPF